MCGSGGALSEPGSMPSNLYPQQFQIRLLGQNFCWHCIKRQQIQSLPRPPIIIVTCFRNMNFDHLAIIAREVLYSYTAKMYWVEQYTSLMTLKISLGPRDVFRTFYNPIHPDSGQCMSFLSSLIHPQGYIRKYIPEGQLGLAMP